MQIIIHDEVLKLCEQAVLDMPANEVCGLLVGRQRGQTYYVEAIYLSENIAAERHHHFEIDPRLHIDIQRQVRQTQQSIIGVWHSHPSGKLEPSETDCLQSILPNYIWIISGISQNEKADRDLHRDKVKYTVNQNVHHTVRHGGYVTDQHDPKLFHLASIKPVSFKTAQSSFCE